MPSAAEVLARHQRAAARQEQLVPRWRAEQRLLVRVWVAELSRSFEVVLAGPAFWERGIGRDWEITRAWVDGVAWDPDHLPDLPLIEPQRPPVPPLALRLEPSYRYELAGVEQRQGRRCFALDVRRRPPRWRRAARHRVHRCRHVRPRRARRERRAPARRGSQLARRHHLRADRAGRRAPCGFRRSCPRTTSCRRSAARRRCTGSSRSPSSRSTRPDSRPRDRRRTRADHRMLRDAPGRDRAARPRRQGRTGPRRHDPGPRSAS